MKKIGIVGGIAWQSTVHYYSELCRRSEQWHAARSGPRVSSTPEISIESLDHAKAVSYIGSDEDEASWSRFDNYHRDALRRLVASGADFALIASNAGHHRFEPIVQGAPIPVISIIDAAAKECVRIGARQVMLLGTALVMRSPGFREGFAKYGVEAAGPRDEAVRAMTIELLTDLQLGKIAGAAEHLSQIAKRGFNPEAKDRPAVCLACTELPLAFEAKKNLATFENDGIVYINTTAVHVDAAFDFAVDQ